MYGRQTQNAITIMSQLAEVYDSGATVSASSIARSRHLAVPTVAKVLSALSTAGLVSGKTGPGGGFVLARDPGSITLFEVFDLFQREAEQTRICPIGGEVCGSGGDQCPLHDRLEAVRSAMDRLLHDTTLEIFRTTGGDPATAGR